MTTATQFMELPPKHLFPTSAGIDVKDTGTMRKFLIAGMKDVMTGQVTTWQAKAACNFAQQIYNVTALEVKVMLAQAKLNGQQIQVVSFIDANPGNPPGPTRAKPTVDVAKPARKKVR